MDDTSLYPLATNRATPRGEPIRGARDERIWSYNHSYRRIANSTSQNVRSWWDGVGRLGFHCVFHGVWCGTMSLLWAENGTGPKRNRTNCSQIMNLAVTFTFIVKEPLRAVWFMEKM